MRHIWIHSDRAEAASELSERYDVPVTVGMPPSLEEQRKYLAPLGETRVWPFQPQLEGPYREFIRATWRWVCVAASRDRANIRAIADQYSAQRLLSAAIAYGPEAAGYYLAKWDISVADVQTAAERAPNPDDIDGTIIHRLLDGVL